MASTAPVNVHYPWPPNAPEWPKWEPIWHRVNTLAEGNEDFHGLTVKAAHVIGSLHDACESVGWLLTHRYSGLMTYVSAYAILAGGVELLGRCLNGNPNHWDGSQRDLQVGLLWLCGKITADHILSDSIEFNLEEVLVKTETAEHSLDDLVARRNFAAHGQATSKLLIGDAMSTQLAKIRDLSLLSAIKPLLCPALERYWYFAMTTEAGCSRLARANVVPILGWQTYKSWRLFSARDGVHRSIEQIFDSIDWPSPSMEVPE